MSTPISDLPTLLRQMEPVLNPGVYAYTSVPHTTDIRPIPAIATVHEVEGVTLIVSEAVAAQHKIPVLFRCAWITLKVHSDLGAVALTAAFAQALGREGISCNVVAGAFHDHVFVPLEAAQKALDALRRLQQG